MKRNLRTSKREGGGRDSAAKRITLMYVLPTYVTVCVKKESKMKL